MRANISHVSCCLLLASLAVQTAAGALPVMLREALAEFETGAIRSTICPADYAVGSRKEISRFQILPVVWRQYSSSRAYHDPSVSWRVASQVLAEREEIFRNATAREWDGVDIYLMWNAPGQYRRANWERDKVSPAVRARAQRFANLLHERSRRHALQTRAAN